MHPLGTARCAGLRSGRAHEGSIRGLIPPRLTSPRSLPLPPPYICPSSPPIRGCAAPCVIPVRVHPHPSTPPYTHLSSRPAHQRLRGALRDPSTVECTLTALQIASLKRVSSGTKVVLLDRYGPAARAVAKELSRKGFGKVYTVQGEEQGLGDEGALGREMRG